MPTPSSKNSENPPDTRFGLRPVHHHRSSAQGPAFVLSAGDNLVGSEPGCAIRIEARGISRRHAVLRLGEDDFEIEDLGSKNGTRVNGRPVERSAVQPGDILGFAEERFAFEQLDEAEADLAVAIDWSTRGEPVSRVLGTPDLTHSSSAAEAIYRELSAFLDRLYRPPGGAVEGALAGLVEATGVAGACLAEWLDDGEAHVLAAAGKVGDPPDRLTLAEAPPLSFDPRLATLTLDRAAGVVRRPSPGESGLLGILLWGGTAPAVSPTLLATLLRILEPFADEGETDGTDAQPGAGPSRLELPDGIVVGPSAEMRSLYEQLEMLGGDDVPVLILGETGVGKEHLAAALHANGPRRDGPFVAVNCAAIPAELLEAELFGIGHGVATGVRRRVGKFVEADGGTLFLDEIGDMPAALQAKLLRVLEERRVSPVGEKPVDIDIRLVAATHADLDAAIKERRFRSDLYYRLAGYVLHVPPLRRRLEDLPVLVGHLLKTLGKETGRPVRGVTVKALQRLAEHPWPGNVRELVHVVRRLLYLCPRHRAVDSRLVAEALVSAGGNPAGEAYALPLGERGLEAHLEEIEGLLIRRALRECRGNRSQAARLLRVSRTGLARRLERLRIDANQFAES